MEEFDSEDFSTSEEDEDYVPSGGEYSEDDVNELVKEDEVDGEEQTQKTKERKRKSQSIPARKRKQGGLSLEEEDEEDANEESGGSSSEEEDGAAEPEKGIESEDAKKKKEDELWASFLNDVGPKSKVPLRTQVKRREEAEETSSSKLLVKAEELEKPKETEKVKITKVFDFAGEEVRVTREVDATSKEAKSFFKQNEKEKPQANVPSALPSLPAGSGKGRRHDSSGLTEDTPHILKLRPDLSLGGGQQFKNAFYVDILRHFHEEMETCLRKSKPGVKQQNEVKKIKWHEQPSGENRSQEAEDEHPREVQAGLGELQGGGGHWRRTSHPQSGEGGVH
ncbi:craniofacial development protein 1 isoform X1 [Pseudorca crassidens]|uniref:craniofacial development protein 1 isoform X1 n=1 Tax=Pseudorca crassidens TaxID=82174 RepID=UPI00352C26E5